MSVARPFSIHLTGRARDDDSQSATRPRRVHRKAHNPSLSAILFTGVVAITVTLGWSSRDHLGITPKHGLGYGLGIAGASAMLILALYPARKSLRFMRSWGSLSHWFRTHMLLGVIGPVLILFHCGFHLGAPNSNVALFSMLIVSASGVVGRYIYTRISHGLYGARATIKDLDAMLDSSAHTLEERLPPTSDAAQRLARFARRAGAQRTGLVSRLFRILVLPFYAAWVQRRIVRDLHRDLLAATRGTQPEGCGTRLNEEETAEVIRDYMNALVKDLQFGAFERLFSLWHALHIPLFIMLVLAGVLHVIAVNMY